MTGTGLHLVHTPLGARVSTLALFTGPDGALLFDTGVDGTVGEWVLPALAELGRRPEDVRHVVVSHCDVDHFGGVAQARALLPRAEVVAHRDDAGAIADREVWERERGREFRPRYGVDEDPDVLTWCRSVAGHGAVDRRLSGDTDVDLGGGVLHLLHVPGHSRGHLAVHDPAAGTVVVSDAVLGAAVPLADGSPSFPPTYRHVADYRATTARLATLQPERLVTAHYGTFTGAEVGRFLSETRAFTDRLEELVLDDLRAHGPTTLPQVLARLNPVAGDWPVEGTATALAFPVVGHLEDLEARGLAKEEDAGWVA